MVPPVNVLSIATAVPPHRLDQRAVTDAARQVYARTFMRYPKLSKVFANAGIERRYSARSLEWLSKPHDLAERTKAYVESASELFVRTARTALDRVGIHAREVDVVVTVSSTGIATPGIEARVGPELGLRSEVMRVPVFGRGCAGGVSGLTLGARLARAEPGEVVLVVVVELCTLTSRTDQGTKSDVISSALFGDGAAAVVLRAEPGEGSLQVAAAAEHTWPRTLDIMGWAIDPLGFRVMLSRSLPRFVEQRIAGPVRRSSSRRVCRGRSSSVIRAVQKCLTPSKRLLNCRKGPCVTSGKFSATMGICRRRPFCSFSNMLCGAACADRLYFRR
jgi:alkylresorcinol/alkylpyrone synthase